ncbi:MAG TPA: hypothetical protein VNO30_34820 [Kofleriaceae bacterium]|nr:hypothetical protein [Kofleriaceae bacterium]
MATAELVALRRDRVRNAFSRVEADVKAWLGRWKERKPQTSQIKRCGEVLGGMLKHLDERIDALPADERALAAGREIEWDLAIVERLFRLLATRFDQRRDPALELTLEAADELIWSCVQQTWGLTANPLPLPLAYIDPAFSPSATPRTKPPSALPARDRLLAEMLRALPVPMIGLPTGTVDEPWWLVLIAHEVGHHVQYDAQAAEQVVTLTGAALKEATGDATWESWRHEVFADLFAVLALGPVAIDATAELEWDVPENMAAGKSLYPPVIVRLALMAECAAAVGHTDVKYGPDSWTDTLAQVSAPRREVVAAQLTHVRAAVAAVLDLPLGRDTPLGRGSLRRLVDKAPPAGAAPDRNTAKLRQWLKGEDASIEKSKGLPRSAVREAFLAYRGLDASAAPEQRAEARRLLRERSVSLITALDDQSTRPVQARADNTAIVDRMVELLRQAEAEAKAEAEAEAESGPA